MQELVKQEKFELEVLDKLNSGKFLNDIAFGGGTMMRLCFGMDRYSVDLDFWCIRGIDQDKLFQKLKDYLGRFYELRDATNKSSTLFFEIKSGDFPRSLKIEVRKETKKIKPEKAIAFRPDSNIQVLLKVVPLNEMMEAKIEAFLNRREIRDIFDMEFLVKKGVKITASDEELRKVLAGIEALTAKDYKVKLGSLLEAKQRKYYCSKNFGILKSAINDKLRN